MTNPKRIPLLVMFLGCSALVSLCSLVPQPLRANEASATKASNSSLEGKEQTSLKIPYEVLTLKNGLQVILHQDQTSPLVAVNVWYHVGGADETPGKSGFAHLFEHMLFQGSQHVGEDMHFEILKRIGASQVNGSTSPDRTNYYQQVPSHELETALWLESDRMGYFLPLVTEKSLQNQIEVVRNERRQRIDNSPYGKTFMRINELMYPEAHPHHYSVIGKHEDLQNAKLQDVIDFYRLWYTPANATLVIAGDIELPKTKTLVEKWFGELVGAPKPERKALSMPNMSKTREQVEEELVRQRMITYAWHTPASHSQDDALLDLCANILGDTGTGRLYKKLVIDKRLATQVTARQRSQEHSSLFIVQAMLSPEADLAEVEKIIQAELQALSAQPPTAAELNRAVKKWESSFIWGLEGLMARAEKLQTYNHYWANPDGLHQDLQRYLQAKPAQIQQVVRSFLQENRLELLTVPAPKS